MDAPATGAHPEDDCPLHPHGTYRRYRFRKCHKPCLCDACRYANAEQRTLDRWKREGGANGRTFVYRPRQQPSQPEPGHDFGGHDPDGDAVLMIGTQRRIRGLARNGHGFTAMAAACDTTRDGLVRIARTCNTEKATIPATLADAVRAFWDEWVALDGDDAEALALAEHCNWPVSWAWLDETMENPETSPWQGVKGKDTVDRVKVDRMCLGERFADATVAERKEAIRRLHYTINTDGRQMSAEEIGRIVGLSDRVVQRWRVELDLIQVPTIAEWGRGPRGTQEEYLNRLARQWMSRLMSRNTRKDLKGDAVTAIADLKEAFQAAGLPLPPRLLGWASSRPQGLAA